MTKHTPGPWGDHGKTILTRGAVFIGHANYDDDEAIANTRLIAAAPEMFEALEAMLTCQVGVVIYTPSDHAVKLSRDALAKAKGE